MKTLTKTIAMVAAMSAPMTAPSTQAADQSAYFEQQRQLTDGYVPPFNVVPAGKTMKPATPCQVAENSWLTAESARGPASLPTPCPAPSVANKVRPTTPPRAAQDNFWQRERDENEGYASPSQFPK